MIKFEDKITVQTLNTVITFIVMIIQGTSPGDRVAEAWDGGREQREEGNGDHMAGQRCT